MPTYVYQVILEDDIEGPTFEYEQSINDEALTHHPVTGHKLVRLIQPPNISTRSGKTIEGKVKDNKHLEKHGFTKYERDKLTGDYHRVAGKEGPPVIKKDV